MAYSIQGNRILPSNWKEARENKWGFKTHSKCAGGIRVCFGAAIKWEVSKGKVIYINTSSVKHWWKANSVWRKEIGFGGNFSKKKLIDLLNAKIQARTTANAIRRASLPPIVNPSQPENPPSNKPSGGSSKSIEPKTIKLVASIDMTKKLSKEEEEKFRKIKEKEFHKFLYEKHKWKRDFKINLPFPPKKPPGFIAVEPPGLFEEYYRKQTVFLINC